MHSVGLRFFPPFAALALAVLAPELSTGRLVSAQAPADRPQAIFERAVAAFRSGRIAESVAAFDTLARLQPDLAPGLWQRGIALYYAGRYRDCRAQFESHRTVNPDDVENAAWHFACVARGETPEHARAALLPVGPDSRKPMREIYEMLRGTLTPGQVLAAAQGQLGSEFYAHLYLGLYFEAFGDSRRALEQITAAAAERYAAAGGYMHTVARIHLEILQRGK
jgi:lipoprotein NlpI